MGGHRTGRRPARRRLRPLTLAARVVPGVPTFAVDDGFWYSVPAGISNRLQIGSMVRVPLGGRRVRGFVVAVEDRPADGLKEVAAVSGEVPVLTPALLDTLRWAAQHYVAPLSVLLERAAPPNLPTLPVPAEPPEHAAPRPHPLGPLAAAAGEGRRGRTTYLLSPSSDLGWLEGVALAVMAAGRSVLVVAPTGEEVEAVAAAGAGLAPGRVAAVTPQLEDKPTTEAWALTATVPGRLLVGSPRVMLWPVAQLGLLVVLEEGRRAMKEKQTPTLHVREVVRARSGRERATALFVGPTPSTELVAAGVEVVRPVPGRRVWPLVEVVDRREEPPGSGVVTERVKAALRAVLRAEGRAFVFTHRRGYAPASRCVSCRQVRRCADCGSRPDPGTHCRRCGAELGPCPTCGGRRFEPLGAAVGRVTEELRRVLGERAVAEAPVPAAVQVGTERDLVHVPNLDLAVVVDADGLILGTDYRAGEEALRVMARLACRLRPGSGRRMMVQTSLPEHAVIAALRRGDPIPYLTEEVAERSRLGYPPTAELMVVEVRGGEDADQLDRALRELSPPGLLGPAATPQGRRWLVQGRDLTGFRRQLRSLVQRWRDSGLTVRVDVDPIDL